jgi:ABC-type branched-subunit amino acid transport system substrate-binding protein
MTFGMQIRLWFHQASARERQAAVAVLGCMAVLAVATLVAVPRDDGRQTTQALGSSSESTVPAGQAPDDGAVTTDPGLPGSEPGDVSTVDGAPLEAQPGQPATSASSSNPSGAAPGAAPSAAPGAAPGTAASVPLTASDRGISDTQIKIGFLIAQVGGLSGAGFALDIRDDADKYAAALTAYVNADGGVLGRQVVPAVRKTDPLNQSDQAAACQAMASDHKVFGVVDVGAISDTPYMKCIAQDNAMPYVHNTIWGTDWLARSKGLEVGYPGAIDRVAQTWVRDLKAMGWLPAGGVVGIIGDKCAATSPIIDNVLKPLLERAGASKVVVEKHDCDAGSIASQPPIWVTRFRAANVTHVMVAASFVSNAIFMNTAAQQGYHPKYSVSDWWQVASDSSAKNYPASQFDGAIAITSNGMLLPQSGKAPWPGWERCNQVAIDAKLPPLKHQASDQELFALCDNFFLMIDGLKAAGPNPTRWDWAAAVQRLGQHPSVMFGPSNFASGKVTGSDTVFTAQWMSGCKCFKAITAPRPAAA